MSGPSGKSTRPEAPDAVLSIDRLTLHVPGMSGEQARTLAEQVARALADWPAGAARSRSIAHLTTTVPTGAGADGVPDGRPDEGRLAARIASAVLDAVVQEAR